MKTKFLLLILISTILSSCDTVKDWFSTDVDTRLEIIVPVSVTPTGMALKSANATESTYAFSKTGTIALDENDDVADYIDKIKEVNVNGVDATVLGLSAGQIIQTLTVSVDSVGTILTLSNITSASGKLTPGVPQATLDQIGTELENDLSITVTVAGTTNYAPMNFTIELGMDALVKAGLF
jgi:hypothetical protein